MRISKEDPRLCFRIRVAASPLSIRPRHRRKLAASIILRWVLVSIPPVSGKGDDDDDVRHVTTIVPTLTERRLIVGENRSKTVLFLQQFVRVRDIIEGELRRITNE